MGGMGWINLAPDRDKCQALVNAAQNCQVPQSVGNFLVSWEPVRFSRRTLLHAV